VVALCCPDKFRGSLSAPEAAAAMARGLRAGGLEARELPLADGGEGTLDALGGERRVARVTGPLGEPVDAAWSVLPDGTAVVEMARASGFALVPENDPLRATTRGTGELIAHVLDAGVRSVIVGVGGSATTDGGLDAVEALGWSLRGARVVVACDVETRFVDAARVYGPQKGADPGQVAELTARLEQLAERYAAETGIDVRALPHAGAAGGLAGGLAAIGAELRPGFDVVAGAAGFAGALAQSALVVTGEGKLDETSLAGKVVGRVLVAAADARVSSAVIAGQVAPGLADGLPGSPRVAALDRLAPSPEEAFERAAELVEQAAKTLA
jgi:glycerate kinase